MVYPEACILEGTGCLTLGEGHARSQEERGKRK